MADIEKKSYYCEKCRKTMDATQFYTSNNLEKYPNDGKFNICKHCMTMHVDNWNPDSYLWIMQEADVPYVPTVWNQLMRTWCKPGKKVKGTTVMGRYLSTMKLKQWKEFRWSDSEYLQEVENNKIKQAMEKSGYSAAEIAETLDKGSFPMAQDAPPPPVAEPQSAEPVNEDYFSRDLEPAEDLDLTEEDRTYLRLKWGRTYKPDEWVTLEQLYNEMMDSYDIQSAGHIDTLKLVCKTSLKANQLLDMGDVDGAQKMIRMYDGLMKSGNFTAAQNKAETGDFIDSIGELIELCEREGYVERYYSEQPKDKVDFTLEDMKRYTKSLVDDETNLNEMIEAAIRQNAQEDKIASESLEEDIVDDTELSIEDLEEQITTDEDFSDFEDFLEQQEIFDAEEE